MSYKLLSQARDNIEGEGEVQICKIERAKITLVVTKDAGGEYHCYRYWKGVFGANWQGQEDRTYSDAEDVLRWIDKPRVEGPDDKATENAFIQWARKR